MRRGTFPACLAIAILTLCCVSSVTGFTKDYFIWNLDGNGNAGPGIQSALTAAGYTGDISTTLPNLTTLLDYRTVWVCLGMFPNARALVDYPAQAATLSSYLDSDSTCAYCEGGDAWNTDPPTTFRSYFKLDWGVPGSSDLNTVTGIAGTFAEGMVFPYSGDNAFVDRLLVQAASTAFYLFQNSSPAYFVMTAYDNGGGTYKTVASSCEIAGLDDGSSTKDELVDAIMTFFGVPKLSFNFDVSVTGVPMPEELTVPNQSVTPLCVVKNSGLQTSGGFYVHVRIDPGAWEESTFVAPLSPDSTTTVPLPSEWTAGNVGQTYNLLAWSNWSQDQRQANDTLRKQLTAWDNRWYIKSPWSDGSQVDMDGVIGGAEWADAATRDVSDFLGRKTQQPPGSAILYVMNDSFGLYLGLDAVFDGSNTNLDNWELYFEDDFSHSWPLFPDSSEGRLTFQASGPPPNAPWFRYWPFFDDTFGVGYWIACYAWCDDASGHMQYEIMIPIGDTIMGADTTGRHHALNASLCDTVGFWTTAADESRRQIYAWWPTSSNVGYGTLADMGMIILNCGLDRYVELEAVSIISPPSPVAPDTDYAVTVRVRNNGTSTEDFWVYARIGSAASPIYQDSSHVTGLASDSLRDASFPFWHSPSIDTTWPMCAWVAAGDSNPGNDTVCKNVRVGVEELSDRRGPAAFYLSQSVPNPFSLSASVTYSVPALARVTLKVFDASGREVRTLVDGDVEPGTYGALWDGRDQGGARLPSGVYFLKMSTGSFRTVRKVMVLR